MDSTKIRSKSSSISTSSQLLVTNIVPIIIALNALPLHCIVGRIWLINLCRHVR